MKLTVIILCFAINSSALYAEKNISSKKQLPKNSNETFLEKNLLSDAAFHPLFMKLNHKNFRSYKLSNFRSNFSKNNVLENDNFNLFSYGKNPRLVSDAKNFNNPSSSPKIQFDENFQYIKKEDGFSLQIADYQKNNKDEELNNINGLYGNISLNVLPKDKYFPDYKKSEMDASGELGYSYHITEKMQLRSAIKASEKIDKNGNISKEVEASIRWDN